MALAAKMISCKTNHDAAGEKRWLSVLGPTVVSTARKGLSYFSLLILLFLLFAKDLLPWLGQV